MNSFINHLVSRHVNIGNHIKPRLRGKFEPPAVTENTLPPDFDNDLSSINNNKTEPQNIRPISKPTFSINEQDHDNSDKHHIDDPLYRQEQKPSDQFSESKDLNAGNTKPVQPLATPPGQQGAQLRSDHANDTKSNDTVFTPEINRVLTNPKTGEVISRDNDNPTIGNSLKNEPPAIHHNINGSAFSDNSDIQTIRTPGDNRGLQSKLTGQVLPADLKWLKNVKQDLSSRNGVQNNQSSTPPIIKVTIGKIEVRALNQSAPVQTRETPKPRMTLDDFLKQRNGGKS